MEHPLCCEWCQILTGCCPKPIRVAIFLTQKSGHLAIIGTNINDCLTNTLEFAQAISFGIMCNALVCPAVWFCFSAHSSTYKILSIIFPITAFVSAGFGHCVVNMYFISIGLFLKEAVPPALWVNINKTAADFTNLTWGKFSDFQFAAGYYW